MTLKEKFDSVILYMDYKDTPKQKDLCVYIADEFAIGFAEWCIESEGKDYNKYKYRNRTELLEIYKKEKGL